VIAAWPCPGPDGPADEYAVAFDRNRDRRLLIVPALFGEANRTRRFLIETMRRLDRRGIDSVLIDLPGCNESLQSFAAQSLGAWRNAVECARRHFRTGEVLAVRGGALLAPADLPGWRLEPVKGASLLRQLLRARIIAAREEGREERSENLLEQGRMEGLELAGYPCSAALIAGLESAAPEPTEAQTDIRQGQLGGRALWLRSEPGEDSAQSDSLAAIIAESRER
jgi:hypothetical protein